MLSSIQFPEHYDKNPTNPFGRQLLRIRGESLSYENAQEGPLKRDKVAFMILSSGNGRKGKHEGKERGERRKG